MTALRVIVADQVLVKPFLALDDVEAELPLLEWLVAESAKLDPAADPRRYVDAHTACREAIPRLVEIIRELRAKAPAKAEARE